MSTNKIRNYDYNVWVIDNGDGTVDVEGDIDITDRNLISLNFITQEIGIIRKLTGNFLCFGNRLTSLEGCPKEIIGGFECGGNKLTSLKGGPITITGGYMCNNNELISLEGSPSIIPKSFYCNHNKLTSLQGGPSEVGQDYHCHNNKLTSLQGAPNSVDIFDCEENPDLFFTEYELHQIKANEYQYDPEQLINDDNIRNYMPF